MIPDKSSTVVSNVIHELVGVLDLTLRLAKTKHAPTMGDLEKTHPNYRHHENVLLRLSQEIATIFVAILCKLEHNV